MVSDKSRNFLKDFATYSRGKSVAEMAESKGISKPRSRPRVEVSERGKRKTMIRLLIWVYVLASVFASSIFMRNYGNMASLGVGILLLVSALVVYTKRKEIENWFSGKGRRSE
jgi:phosphatidylglycerophosphate synthase